MATLTPNERASIEAILAEHQSFVLATEGEDGPWVTAMFMGAEFEDDGAPVFYCAQHLGSRAALNAGARSAVAVFVGGGAPTRWLQMAATATAVPEEQHAHANAVLTAHAPQAADYVQLAIDQSGGVTYLAIRPRRIEIRDLSVSPPVFANVELEAEGERKG